MKELVPGSEARNRGGSCTSPPIALLFLLSPLPSRRRLQRQIGQEEWASLQAKQVNYDAPHMCAESTIALLLVFAGRSLLACHCGAFGIRMATGKNTIAYSEAPAAKIPRSPTKPSRLYGPQGSSPPRAAPYQGPSRLGIAANERQRLRGSQHPSHTIARQSSRLIHSHRMSAPLHGNSTSGHSTNISARSSCNRAVRICMAHHVAGGVQSSHLLPSVAAVDVGTFDDPTLP